MFPSEISELQTLKSKLLQYVAAKENSLSILEKQIEASLSKERDTECASLVKEVAEEEQTQDQLDKISQHDRKLTQKMSLIEQIEERKISVAEQDAQNAIENSMKEDIGKKLKAEKKQKRIDNSNEKREYRSKLQDQVNQQQIQKKKAQEDDKQLDQLNDTLLQMKIVNEEIDKEIKDRNALERSQLQLQEMTILKERQMIRQERRNLLEEISCLDKSMKEARIDAERKLLEKEKLSDLIGKRDDQLRLKKEQEKDSNLREEEYSRLLMDLQREEAKLDDLKAETRRRRTLDHRAAVQKIIEARRLRRLELQREFDMAGRAETELSSLRQQIFEEEEKKLILENLPHLEPHLGRKLLSKLAIL